MKSKIVEEETKEDKQKFPVIAKSKKDSAIILFSDNKVGVVLAKGNDNRSSEIGYYCEDWFSCFNVEYWQILDSVTITFES